MKKLMIVMFVVLAMVGIMANVGYCAKAYTVDVTSWPVSTAHVAQFVCTVSSASTPTSILKLHVSKDDSTVAQTVTIYENCNSTTTATKLWVIHLGSGTVDNESILTFDNATPLTATRGIVIRKSSPACNVQCNLLVR
jgi:hypothetical protein